MKAVRTLAVLFALLVLMAICHFPPASVLVAGRAKIQNEGLLPGADESLSPRTRDDTQGSYFTPETIEKGKKYRSTKYAAFFLTTSLSLVFLFLFLRMRGTEWVTSHLGMSQTTPPWLAAGIFAVVLTIAIALVTLPVSFYSGFIHEHSWGLSTRGIGGWLADYGKYLLLQAALAFVIFAGLYRLMAAFPIRWWIVAGFLFATFIIVMAALSPLIIDPIFNKFTPISDQKLKNKIVELSRNAGLSVENVYEMDASVRTRTLNAYFTGIGRTKRVVIYDNLLRNTSRAEVVMVLAHELGHWRRAHLWKGIALAAAGTFIVVFILSRLLSSGSVARWHIPSFDHPAGVPLVMLVVLLCGYISMPVQNAVSRHFERQADMDSLLLTRDPDTFIKVEERMAETNLSDVQPHPLIKWLLFTHPPTLERIEMAEEFRKNVDTLPGEEKI
jgi:STE24 endopeptidase